MIVREYLIEKKFARAAALAAGLAGSGCAALGTCDQDQNDAFRFTDKPVMQRTVADTTFQNPRLILQNSLNGITVAALTGGNVKKAINSFFKDLRLASRKGDISRKEARAIISALRNKDTVAGIKKASAIIGTGK